MLGQLYEQALNGELCYLRHDGGERAVLPVPQWIGGTQADHLFDDTVIAMCKGPTLDLGCGPGRLVAALVARGIPALGIDQSPTAVRLAHRTGAPAVCGDLFDPIPGAGGWQTALLVDGNIGLGGDPVRVLRRSAELLFAGGRCLAEFSPAITGVQRRRVRLESGSGKGPWFDWACVGLDAAIDVAAQAGLAMLAVHHLGGRALAEFVARR